MKEFSKRLSQGRYPFAMGGGSRDFRLSPCLCRHFIPFQAASSCRARHVAAWNVAVILDDRALFGDDLRRIFVSCARERAHDLSNRTSRIAKYRNAVIVRNCWV